MYKPIPNYHDMSKEMQESVEAFVCLFIKLRNKKLAEGKDLCYTERQQKAKTPKDR